jgi:DNA-directed RNA polymerase specialized sigma24 family protein
MTSRGDESDLFAELHGPLVSKLTGALGGDRHLAEEAATLAWLILLRRQPERSPQLGGWLYVTGLHEAWRIRRRQQRDDSLFAAPELPDLVGVGRDPVEILRERDQLQLLNQLPPAQRVTLGLFARGYSYREIAQLTGHSYTWVNRHITEGRARIRQLNNDD